ncbi:MAG: penicillin acylase family protein [Candidatus Kariarchaeaceae archaeon]
MIVQRVIRITIFILLFVSLGIYSGIRNAEDDIFQNLEFMDIEEQVKVYRDEMGVPTIIAKNINDLAFVQGFEFARDRTFQLEMFHAMINAELSNLFGIDLLDADILSKTLDFKSVGERAANRLDQAHIDIIESYVNGINQYYDQHVFNLPLEFELLGIDASEWTVADSLAMQAIMTYNFDFSGYSNELIRLEVVQQIGINQSLELLPINYQPAENYLSSINSSYIDFDTAFKDPFSNIFQKQSFQPLTGNNWVINGSKSISDKPIVANDPHLRLNIPSFWYQINLQLSDNSLNAEGFAVPGLPLILVGHNSDVAWGIGPSNIDTLDLLYFNSNSTHYLHNGSWKEFAIEEIEILVTGVSPLIHKIYRTDFGPVLNITDGWYAVKWILHENRLDDQMFRAFHEINTAKNIEDIRNGLKYLSSPSLDFVFADIESNIGVQSAGLIPIRVNDHGVIPQNGSSFDNIWTDFVDYENMKSITNPDSQYLIGSNFVTDDNSSNYIYEKRIQDFRNQRINQLFNETEGLLQDSDIVRFQNDIYNIAAENMLSPLLNPLTIEINVQGLDDLIPLIVELSTWDYMMDVKSSAATIFSTFRLYFNQEVYKDELGIELSNTISNDLIGHLNDLLNSNQTDSWFDDKTTANVTEDASDIAIRALTNTYEYLTNDLGNNIAEWNWGNVHQITYNHVIGGSAQIFEGLNLGPVSANGSIFTINSYVDSPTMIGSKPNFDSYQGPAFRLIMEVSTGWINVTGMHSPGMSGHLASDHYDDGYDEWTHSRYSYWMFNPLDVVLTQELSITYSHGDSNE